MILSCLSPLNKENEQNQLHVFENSSLYFKIVMALILELLKGAKRLQSNSDFMNKIKERSNAAIFKPNATIRLGALFITNCGRHNHENKELQIILTIPDFSRGINKTSSIS